MKKTYLIYSLVLLNVSLACSQKENHPPIEDFNKDLANGDSTVQSILDDYVYWWYHDSVVNKRF